MLRRFYDRIISLSAHPRALLWLGVLSIAESSVFPLAPDILIIPMVLARPRQAWRIAAVATGGSILGGLLGYAIGHFLFRAIGQPIVDFYGLQPLIDEFRQLYRQLGHIDRDGGRLHPHPL